MIKQDDELDKLEEDIRRLKNRYDQFFNGITKTPPSFERHQVEAVVHEISKQKMRDNARRFRFNTILSRYNQFREMWARKMREREEGPLDFRRRQALMESVPIAPPPPPPRPPVTSARPDPYVRMTPGANGEEIRKLYGEIERAHLEMGKLPNVSLEQLASMIQKQSDVVRAKYNVKTVAFRVETIDGKVKLKAKPLQD
ncbi:MAG: MXAN_5187 C-terminal domain-containing protein [Thermoanaerobaculia bacterium]